MNDLVLPMTLNVKAEYYENEVWRPIINIAELSEIKIDNYMISNYGRVYSKHKQCIMSPYIGNSGYYAIKLKLINDKKQDFHIDRLVAYSFLCGDVNYNKFVIHKNLNIKDNNAYNLQWVDWPEYCDYLLKLNNYYVEGTYYKILNTSVPPFINLYENNYIVSNIGCIINLMNSTVYSSINSTNMDNPEVTLYGKNGYCHTLCLKRIIIYTFKYREDYFRLEVVNLDGNKKNCHIDNLEYRDNIIKEPVTVPIKRTVLLYELINIPKISEDEIWTTIPSIGELAKYNTHGYFVSNYGRTYSIKTNSILKNSKARNNYIKIALPTKENNINNIKQVFVHRVVLIAFSFFIGCENYQVNHINGIHNDNRLLNLEWCDAKYNINHAYENKLNMNYGENHSEAIYTYNDVCNVIDAYIKGFTNIKIQNMYPHININFINDVICARARFIDIRNYLINNNYTLSKYYGNNKNKIINICKSSNSRTDVCKLLGIRLHTIDRIIISLTYYIIKNNNDKWVDYLSY